MLSLVYVSTAVERFSEPELVQLLSKCRLKNAPQEITGLLLYKNQSFIQVLEGPDDVVRSKFLTISQDQRHRGIIRLLETPIKERRFPDWSMGFRNLNDPAIRDTPGYSEFLNESFTPETFRADPSRAMHLLGIFRRNMSR
jgi:hypothetical protein